ESEGEPPAELGQEGETRTLVQPPIEPQDPEARAVIERGVLEGPPARDFHELHVDLDGRPRLGLLKELHLPRHPLAGAPQARQADIPKDSLDCADRHPDLVNAPQPELGALGAILELAARLADQLDDSPRDSPAAAPRVSRHEALHRILPPAHP